MKNAVFVKIGIAAKQLGKSRREIVILLLTRIRKDFHHFPGGFGLVKYQPRDPSKEWHTFTITFKYGENELVTDFRKFGKLSVSYFVRIAAERYLDELLADGGKSHNYVKLCRYTLGQRVQKGSLCWETWWEYTGKIHKPGTNTRIHRRTNAF